LVTTKHPLSLPVFRPGPKATVLKEPAGSSIKLAIWIVRSPLDDSVEEGENVSVGVTMLGLGHKAPSVEVVVVAAVVQVVVRVDGSVGSHPMRKSNDSSTDVGTCVCINVIVVFGFESAVVLALFVVGRGYPPNAPSGNVALRESPLRIGPCVCICTGKCARFVHTPIAWC
jgi:hypothetical protein